MDLLLGADNDLVFLNGQCPVTSTDFNVVAQRLSIRLKTFLGEYNFNTGYGVPYLQSILGKRVRKVEVDNIMQQQILLEDGVMELVEFSSTLENFVYSMTFKVKNDKALISPVVNISVTI